MVIFKGRWGKLYYIQHTHLSNIRQLLILFLINKHIHTKEREKERDSNTKTRHKSTQMS